MRNSSVSAHALGRYYTTHQVARLVGASPSTVLVWVDRGWLPAHRTPGGHRRIEQQALLAFLRSHDMPIPAPLERSARLVIALSDLSEGRALKQELTTLDPNIEIEEVSGLVAAIARLAVEPADALILEGTSPLFAPPDLIKQIRALPNLSNLAVAIVLPLNARGNDEAAQFRDATLLLSRPFEPRKLLTELHMLNLQPVRAAAI